MKIRSEIRLVHSTIMPTQGGGLVAIMILFGGGMFLLGAIFPTLIIAFYLDSFRPLYYLLGMLTMVWAGVFCIKG